MLADCSVRLASSKNSLAIVAVITAIVLPALIASATASPVFSDDFNDGILNTTKWVEDTVGDGNSYDESDGVANFTTYGHGDYESGHAVLWSKRIDAEGWGKIDVSGKWKYNSSTAEMFVDLYCFDNSDERIGVHYAAWLFEDKADNIRFYSGNNFEFSLRNVPEEMTDFEIVVYADHFEYWEDGERVKTINTTALSGCEAFKLRIGGYDESPFYSHLYFDDIVVNITINRKPHVFIHSPRNEWVYNKSEIWLNVTADQPIDEWFYSIDNSDNESFIPNVLLNLSDGIHKITVYGRNKNGTGWNASTFDVDTTPPASVSNLTHKVGVSWIEWGWKNPKNDDFLCTLVFFDGKFEGCLKDEFYNAVNLTPNTLHVISTRTKDIAGNVNGSWVNDTARTLIGANTVFVNESGWWFANGSFNANQTPIQAGIDNVPNGGEVIVLEGNYTESVVVNKRITVSSRGARVAGVKDYVFKLASPSTLRNFTIVGSGGVYTGIFIESPSCVVEDNSIKISNAAGDLRYGIYLYYSDNCVVANNRIEVSGFQSRGVYAYYSPRAEVRDNDVAVYGDASQSLQFFGSENSRILSNRLRFGGIANNEGYGLLLYTSPDSVIDGNDIARSQKEDNAWEVDVVASPNCTFSHNEIVGTEVSFHYSNEWLKFRSVAENSTPPNQGYLSIFQFETMKADGGWIFVNVSYDEAEIDPVNETTLKIWHLVDFWEVWNGTILDTQNNVVGAKISQFSIFGVFGRVTNDNTPPVLAYQPPTPPNNGIMSWQVKRVTINATSNEELESCILEWNGVNESFNPTNKTVCRITKPVQPGASYTFNVYGIDLAGNVGEAGKRRFSLVSSPVPQPPLASFTHTPPHPEVGEIVTFDASSSHDPDGSIVSYHWDFGDGRNATGVVVTHAFSSAGVYTVRLIVTDNDGYRGEAEEEIEVIYIDNDPPVITLVYPSIVERGDRCNITVTIADENPATYYVYRNSSLIESGSYENSIPFDIEINSTVGVWSYEIIAYDMAGNSNASTAVITVRDTKPPIINFTSPTPENREVTNETRFEIRVDANEKLSTATLYWYRSVYAMTETGSGWVAEVTVSSDWTYPFKVYGCDLYGNCAWSEERQVTVDTVKPRYSDQQQSAGEIAVNSTIELKAYWDDVHLSHVWLLIDDVPVAYQYFGHGDWVVFHFTPNESFAGKDVCWRMRANDSAKNSNETPEMCFRVYDEIPPVIHLTYPSIVERGDRCNITVTIEETSPSTYYVYRNGSLVESGSYENSIPFEIVVDTSVTGVWNYTIVAYGTNFAFDVNRSTAVIRVVDTKQPVLTYQPPTPNGSVNFTYSVTINATSNEELKSCILEWNGVNESFIPANKTVCRITKPVQPGASYTFNVYGIDLAGNVGEAGERSVNISPIPDTGGKTEYPVLNVNTGKSFPSIRSAILDSSTKDGHTIIAYDGVYDGFTVTKSLTIVSFSRWGAKILGGVIVNSDNAVIRGFDAESIEVIGNNVSVVENAANRISVLGSGNVVEDNVISASRGEGIEVNGDGNRIIGNIIFSSANGIRIRGKNVAVENNVLRCMIHDVSELNRFPSPPPALKALKIEVPESVGKGLINAGIKPECGSGVIAHMYASSVRNNTVLGFATAVELDDSERVTISENWIVLNELGLTLKNSVENRIYDNVFLNHKNVVVENSWRNEWNVEKPVNGRNVIGGAYIGGNYWSDYTGSDGNGDGLGDVAYSINPRNADEYPLVIVDLPVLNANTFIRYQTIQSAIDDDRTGGGDVILISPTRLVESVVVDKSVKIKAESGGKVTIISRSTEPALEVDASNVEISGLVIVGKGTGVLLKADSCKIHGNRIRGGKTGIEITSDGNEIASNYIVDNGVGMKISGSNNSIYNNYLANARNAESSGNGNVWNASLKAGKNIVGGNYIGGNYWSDYNGSDNNGDGVGDQPYFVSGEQMPDYHPLVLSRSAAIHINGNDEFTMQNGVLYGSGTADDPYVIEGYTIDSPASFAILIENTDAHFVVRNCVVHSYYIDIHLRNVTNGRIESVRTMDLSTYKAGILIESSSNVVVADSRIKAFGLSNGIVATSSSDVQITRNTVEGCFYSGIKLYGSDSNVVSENRVLSGMRSGILLERSNGNEISGNIVKGNKHGINVTSSNGNRILGNDVVSNIRCYTTYYPSGYGVYGCHGSGLLFVNSSRNYVEENSITENRVGIDIRASSDNTVKANVISKSRDIGFILSASNNNRILNNSFSANPALRIIDTSSNNTVIGNAFNDGFYGVSVYAYHNIIASNTFQGNAIDAIVYGSGNLVYNNYFGDDAYGDTSANKWNITKTAGRNIIGGKFMGGNYWSNYNGADFDLDGIGDTDIPWRGDYYPLVNVTTIHIVGNDDFTAENKVFSGSGTADDPYVIENLQLNSVRAHGIYIENTTAHFIIRNVVINGGNGIMRLCDGIRLKNVTNGRIENVTVSNAFHGVYIESSSSIDVDSSNLTRNFAGVEIVRSTGISVEGSDLAYSVGMGAQLGYAVRIDSSSHVRVDNNSIARNLVSVIAYNSSYINLTGNDFDAQIRLIASQNVSIRENAFKLISGGRAISIQNSTSTIEGNIVENANVAFSISQSDARLRMNNITSEYGVKAENSDIVVENNRISSYINGIEALSCNAEVRNNIVNAGKYGVHVKDSKVNVSMNYVETDVTGNTAAVFAENSGGIVENNLLVHNANGVKLLDSSISVARNTITDARDGVYVKSGTGEVRENRVYGCDRGITAYLSNVAIHDNSAYLNGHNTYLIGSVAASTYTGLIGDLKPPKFRMWDSGNAGSDILSASITSITSTMYGENRTAGDLVSFHVIAKARYGIAKERLYIVSGNNRTVLLSKNHSGVKTIDKAVVASISSFPDGVYDVYYEIEDSIGNDAVGYAQMDIRNVHLVIEDVKTTEARRIYSWVKATGDNTFPAYDRGAFVYVRVKNEGVKDGFGRVEIQVPAFLHNVTGDPVSIIHLNASEEVNLTFYILMTRYDWRGWEPSDPSVFPENKTINVKIRLSNLPSYTLADERKEKVHFRLGPVFQVRKFRFDLPHYIALFLKGNDPEMPYDGDGDNVLEAAESHHFNLRFVNIGDEPAEIKRVVYTELIPCNASKYRPKPGKYIKWQSEFYESEGTPWWQPFVMADPELDIYYEPANADKLSTQLFGMLYPIPADAYTDWHSGNWSEFNSNYSIHKDLRWGWIDWWPDDPASGIYPPSDYSGEVYSYANIMYSAGGNDYVTSSINRIPISVVALNKTFIPMEYTLKNGDIRLKVYAADVEKDVVHFTIHNLNDYVYFEYMADGLYNPSPKGYEWYHVVPPEYKFNVFAEKAKDPTKSIAHMKVNFGVRWSAWANELKLGMMASEAIVNIILDWATGGAIEVEFADNVMSITNTLLQIMNAYESIEHNVTPIVKIDGIIFDHEKIQSLESNGLNSTYFDKVKRGDIDPAMAVTLIKAIYRDDDLRKVFERELLKVICKNLGLEDLYNRINDPQSALGDDFDNFKDELLEYLKSRKKITKAQAEKIDKGVTVAQVFIDLGTWAYNNIQAAGGDMVTINVLDPVGNLSVSVEEKQENYFGGSYSREVKGGNGKVRMELIDGGLVRITGVYRMNSSKGEDLLKEMRVQLKGKRENGVMAGKVVIEMKPLPSKALWAFAAFNNRKAVESLVSQHLSRIDRMNVSGDEEIRIEAEGIINCQPNDVEINSTIVVNGSGVYAKIERVGYYGRVEEGKMRLNMTFGPVAGVALNDTSLSVLGAKEIDSDLPFRKVDSRYVLNSLPEKIEMSAVIGSPEGGSAGGSAEIIPFIIGIGAAIAVIAAVTIIRRRR